MGKLNLTKKEWNFNSSHQKRKCTTNYWVASNMKIRMFVVVKQEWKSGRPRLF